jgi:short-subunit dehydrogenase
MTLTYVLPRAWQVIWITGASTGIGRELALRLAAAGAKVAVSARSADKLAELAALSPHIRAYPFDVTDLAATTSVADAISRDMGPIDLAILNAGVWIPMGATAYDPAAVTKSMAVNYTGVTNALAPLLPAMIKRKSGHIAIVSSVAGYRGLPVAISYAPTKAALISLAETLYPDLLDENVKLTVINPGFVDTPMTKLNDFPMPFMVSTEFAADAIIKGLIRGKFEIVFPWQMKLMAKFSRLLPYWLYFGFINTLPSPPPSLPDAPSKPSDERAS